MSVYIGSLFTSCLQMIQMMSVQFQQKYHTHCSLQPSLDFASAAMLLDFTTEKLLMFSLEEGELEDNYAQQQQFCGYRMFHMI